MPSLLIFFYIFFFLDLQNMFYIPYFIAVIKQNHREKFYLATVDNAIKSFNIYKTYNKTISQKNNNFFHVVLC